MNGNILFVGDRECTDSRIAAAVAGKPTVSAHYTISTVGIEVLLKRAEQTGETVIAQGIEWWRSDVKKILKDELKKGTVKCMAYAGACRCGRDRRSCGCTARNLRDYRDRLKTLGDVFDIVETV